MSLLEPEDPDDIFASIVAGMDVEDPDDVIDLSTLTDAALSSRFNDVREALLAIGEMHPDAVPTAEGRELHSIRAACLLEMRQRGWADPE